MTCFLGVLMMMTAVLGAPAAASPAAASPIAASPADVDDFLTALRASGPHAGVSHLYDGLIGSWEGEAVDHLADGSTRRQSVEVHMAWVLEGRAIQDLFIVPARTNRGAAGAATPLRAADGNRYGTTLRVYDPAIDAWRITWQNPALGVEARLVGRRVGDTIVQTGSSPDGALIRWVFDKVLPDAFHWRGERSVDGGATWVCDTEFFAHRRPQGSGHAAAAAALRSSIRWERTDRPGLEALDLARSAGDVVADGSVAGDLDGKPLTAHYRIEHDGAWRFRRAEIEIGRFGATRQLRIARRDDGSWEVDGVSRPDLAGCEDLDLMVTPYTNTPPLAAQPLAPGQSRQLRVAWVHFPDLAIHAVPQEYTRLDAGTAPHRFRYRNLESGFIGELTLDAAGLVVEYGPWRRR